MLLTKLLYWVFRLYFGVVAVAGALVTAALTMGICYAMAKDRGHIESSGTPSISATGDKDPEHTVFALKFSGVAALVSVAMTLRASHLFIFIQPSTPIKAIGGRLQKLSVVWRWVLHSCNVLLLVLGLAHAIPLIMMAAIPDSQSSVHFQSAIVALGILAVYGVLHAVVQFTQTWWIRRMIVFWYLAWAILSPVMVLLWIKSGSGEQERENNYEWLGVISLFVYFLPLLVEFVLAPFDFRRLMADSDGVESSRLINLAD